MRTFVDTNILVHAVDQADARRRSIARDVLAVGADGGLVVSTQVLSEFLVADALPHPRHDPPPPVEAHEVQVVLHHPAHPLERDLDERERRRN